MLISRVPVAAPKLDDLAAAVRRGETAAEADPFDDAMVAGVSSLAEAMRSERADLDPLRARMVRLARQVSR